MLANVMQTNITKTRFTTDESSPDGSLPPLRKICFRTPICLRTVNDFFAFICNASHQYLLRIPSAKQDKFVDNWSGYKAPLEESERNRFDLSLVEYAHGLTHPCWLCVLQHPIVLQPAVCITAFPSKDIVFVVQN